VRGRSEGSRRPRREERETSVRSKRSTPPAAAERLRRRGRFPEQRERGAGAPGSSCSGSRASSGEASHRDPRSFDLVVSARRDAKSKSVQLRRDARRRQALHHHRPDHRGEISRSGCGLSANGGVGSLEGYP
jgi:hypothetical protein